ncbi:MAG: hypothetical protein RR312_01220 [Bacteroidales bacterium]
MQFKDTLRKLILLSITAVAVFSCITVDKSLGEGYIPEDQTLKVMTAEFRIPIGLKMEDSLQGMSSEILTIGAIKTTEFGLATFSVAANVCQPAKKFRFGKDPVITQIYVSAAAAKTTVIDDSQKSIPQNFIVYRTNKVIDSTTLYNNSITLADYNPTSLNLSSATYFGGDSIRVYLKNEYGTELLSATEEELDSINLFIKRFKGLYITCTPPEVGLNGGRVNHFNYTSASITIKYNFQPTWKDGLSRKDTTVLFRVGDGVCLNTSSYSTSGMATNKLLKELPIEGVAGIKPYIDAQVLKDTLDNWSKRNQYDQTKILIAKASVSFPFEIPQNFDMTKYPTYLFPTYRTDSTSHYYYPLMDIGSTGNSLGVINRSLREYQGNISTTIQKMINAVKVNGQISNEYNIWLAPIQLITDEYSGSTSYISNVNEYYVGKINGPAAARYPKLTIVYSVLK